MFTSPNANIFSHHALQFSYTKEGIYDIMFIIPAILNFTTLIPLSFYNLTGKKLKTMQEELAIKRERSIEKKEKEKNLSNLNISTITDDKKGE
ncbi:MAG: hypothetical protein WCR54_04520 [Clostridia bacterium]